LRLLWIKNGLLRNSAYYLRVKGIFLKELRGVIWERKGGKEVG